MAPGAVPRTRRRMSLAGQYLLLQLLIVAVVLAGVFAISVAQSTRAFERTESRRALSAAETLAALPVVRATLPDTEPRMGAALPAATESVRALSGTSLALLATPDGTVVASTDPTLLGTELSRPAGSRPGRAWTGRAGFGGRETLAAYVPVIGDGGDVAGTAVVAREYPSFLELASAATPNLAVYLGISLALGTAGSLLLSRRVKRQTLGLEPREIAALAEHREAVLHGIREGVVAVDGSGRVTVANTPARELLRLPDDAVGRTVAGLGLDPAVRDALLEQEAITDRLVLAGERLLVLNRRPLRERGRVEGAVTTLRDRTELETLERELGTTRATTEMLRAQTHEFANQLHTISGLIQLGRYDAVVGFVDGIQEDRTAFRDAVAARIADPAVAALLVAKSSLAAERGVRLVVEPASCLGAVGDDLARDLSSVVGNLVDNALDASAGSPGAEVSVLVEDAGGRVRITVADSGPGVPEADLDAVFRQGYSTKDGQRGNRGYGLAIVRAVCARRGGRVAVHNDDGAVFTAEMDRGPA